MEKWHRHFGVYGICLNKEKLLVIRKHGGPYTGRYDLPGGSIEASESLMAAIAREFIEETGMQIRVTKNIGTKDFLVPWKRQEYDHTHCHHIANFYEAVYIAGDPKDSPMIDDSRGAEWIETDKLSIENSSPLVMEAVEYIKTGSLNCALTAFSDWTVKTSNWIEVQ